MSGTREYVVKVRVPGKQAGNDIGDLKARVLTPTRGEPVKRHRAVRVRVSDYISIIFSTVTASLKFENSLPPEVICMDLDLGA